MLFRSFYLITKPNCISQLLSPLFAKMVEPTPLTLHKGYGYYPRSFSLPLFHILLSPSPPSMVNSEPTTVNTTNGHKMKKYISQPKENPTISCNHKKKKFPIINTTTNHTNPPPSQPKLQTTTTNIESPNTPTQNIQIDDPKLLLKPTNTENPNPNPGILRSKTKITKMRRGFLFLGIYLCVDEHGEWV